MNVADFEKGSHPILLGRQMEIVDYGDEKTRLYFDSSSQERTLGLVKPDAYEKMGEIMSTAENAGLRVRRARIVKLSRAQAERFYEDRRDWAHFSRLIDFITSDVVVALELSGSEAVDRWKYLCDEKGLRGQFGRDEIRNAVHGSDSRDSSIRELDFFFGMEAASFPTTALFNNCTLCLIKPHAFREHVGPIISMVLKADFEISAMDTFLLSLEDAEKFVQVYKAIGVADDLAKELAKGPLLAMELRQTNAVQKLRILAGPSDPAMAKLVAKESVRAVFGNAIHCTDLEEDGVSESRFFFSRYV